MPQSVLLISSDSLPRPARSPAMDKSDYAPIERRKDEANAGFVALIRLERAWAGTFDFR